MADHYDSATVSDYNEHPASIKAQLATWHATRGDKSFLRAMIPTYKTEADDVEATTKNPFKLLGMVSPFAWAMFFSVSEVSSISLCAANFRHRSMILLGLPLLVCVVVAA
jgi:hypothetical protein